MNIDDRSQVYQALLGRRDAIADSWYKAIAQTNFAPHSVAEVRQHLVELTEEAIALLLTEPFDHGRAEAIGASLAGLHYVEPKVLGQTQEVLGQQLVEGLLAEQVVELQPQLAALQGGLATGFSQQAREVLLAEQEWIRGGLTSALRQAREALQRAYEEVEQQVQERTAELSAANEQLKQEIAERRQMEKALRHAARQWHATFDAIKDTVCLLDPGGRIQRCNEAMAKLLGKPFNEIVGHNCWELVHSRSEPIEECPVVRMRESRCRETVVLPRRDRWFDISADPVLDEAGDLIGAVHIMSDITERKRAAEALQKAHGELERRVEERTAELAVANEQLRQEIEERKQAEEELIRLSSAVKTSVDSIVIIDLEGEITDVNEAALKMYGTDDKGDLIGQDILGLIAPEQRENALAGIEFVLEKGYDKSRDYEVITKDGSRIPVELSAAVMKDADGKPIGIVIIARDITERKRAEEALRDREATMRALLNAPVEAAILLDANGTILALNETAAQRFGKNADELVGLCIYDLWPPTVAKFRKARTDKVFRSGAPLRFEDEYRGRCLDHSLYPVFAAQGKVVRIAVFVRDITHRRQADERIRTYQERLRSLASQLSLTEERERRRIAAALHDRVGQTLAICKMKLGGLRKSASSTELAKPLDEIHEFIKEIIRDTRSLTLELSSPILYELGLEAAVEWLTEQTQERHGISSQFRDDGQPKPLDDDVRILLFQAVRELLVNVAKHAQARSVKVAMRRDDGNVQIIVADDGVGFDVFPIGSQWSRTEGFGLFSIRERLDHVGGQLRIESESGHGTQITLIAPLDREQTAGSQ